MKKILSLQFLLMLTSYTLQFQQNKLSKLHTLLPVIFSYTKRNYKNV